MNFNVIQKHKDAVCDNIAKSCGVEPLSTTISLQPLEKAHNVGDIHPNGKWVWTQLPSGKYDWRVIKKQGDGQPSTALSSGGNDGGNKNAGEQNKKPTNDNKKMSAASKDAVIDAVFKSCFIERTYKYGDGGEVTFGPNNLMGYSEYDGACFLPDRKLFPRGDSLDLGSKSVSEIMRLALYRGNDSFSVKYNTKQVWRRGDNIHISGIGKIPIDIFEDYAKEISNFLEKSKPIKISKQDFENGNYTAPNIANIYRSWGGPVYSGGYGASSQQVDFSVEDGKAEFKINDQNYGDHYYRTFSLDGDDFKKILPHVEKWDYQNSKVKMQGNGCMDYWDSKRTCWRTMYNAQDILKEYISDKINISNDGSNTASTNKNK